MSLRERLEALVDGLPEAGCVTVPVAWIQRILEEEPTLEERDRLFTVEDLAARYDRSPSTVREWVAAGEIPGAFKLHGAWRVPAKGVAEFERGRKKALGGAEHEDMGRWRDLL